jgi:hypothetical protein
MQVQGLDPPLIEASLDPVGHVKPKERDLQSVQLKEHALL